MTFHDCRIHLDFTEAVQRRAGAGIEERIVFETNDSGFYGVERSAALLKNRPTGERRCLAAFESGGKTIVFDRPGAAVHDNRR